MKLIDADVLAKFIDYGHINNPNDKNYSENDIREMIDMMMTVDAVQVIRCKDCRHYNSTPINMGYCHGVWGLYVEENDYCSHAERGDE